MPGAVIEFRGSLVDPVLFDELPEIVKVALSRNPNPQPVVVPDVAVGMHGIDRQKQYIVVRLGDNVLHQPFGQIPDLLGQLMLLNEAAPHVPKNVRSQLTRSLRHTDNEIVGLSELPSSAARLPPRILLGRKMEFATDSMPGDDRQIFELFLEEEFVEAVANPRDLADGLLGKSMA